MNHPAVSITIGLLMLAFIHYSYTKPLKPGTRAKNSDPMPNRYTCINSDGELAELEAGQVPFWYSRSGAREAAKKEAGKWSIITVGSRRYHAGVAATFGKFASPELEPQEDEPEN